MLKTKDEHTEATQI